MTTLVTMQLWLFGLYTLCLLAGGGFIWHLIFQGLQSARDAERRDRERRRRDRLGGMAGEAQAIIEQRRPQARRAGA